MPRLLYDWQETSVQPSTLGQEYLQVMPVRAVAAVVSARPAPMPFVPSMHSIPFLRPARSSMLPAFLLVLLLAGCSAPAPTSEVDIRHVHGLAYDSSTSMLYLATHHGIAAGTSGTGEGWTWAYVGGERSDFMGFTQDHVANATFYSSGHPADPQAFGGVHLGLRRSTDGAQTWEQRSLKGQADFHALSALPSGTGHLAAYWQGVLKVSRDGGHTWQDHPAPPSPILALAGSQGYVNYVWAGTASGLYVTSDLATWTQVGAEFMAGVVSSLAVSRDGQTLFASTADGRSGSSWRSADGGVTWTAITEPLLRAPAAPVLFAFDHRDTSPVLHHVFASTADAQILESHDSGTTWQVIR